MTALLHSPAGEFLVASDAITSIVALDPRNRETNDWVVVISTDDAKHEVFRDRDGDVARSFIRVLKAAVAERPVVDCAVPTFDLDTFAATFALAQQTGANL